VNFSFLSLLNIFAHTIDDVDYQQMKQREKDMLPIKMLVILDDELRRIPDFIKTIAKDINLDLNIDHVLKNNKQVLGKLEIPTESISSIEADEENWEFDNLELKNECLKHGINIPIRTDSDDNENLSELVTHQYKLLIECLLISYNAGLLSKAETQLLKLKSEL